MRAADGGGDHGLGRIDRADFYQLPHYEEWLARTSEEMRNAKPIVME